MRTDDISEEVRKEEGERSLGLYLHIPFCVRKCLYCDFLSFPSAENMRAQYIRALINELKSASGVYGGRRVDTVFIGGGTPSVLPADAIRELLDTVFDCFCVLPDAEITMEMNPGAAYSVPELRKLSYGSGKGQTGKAKSIDRGCPGGRNIGIGDRNCGISNRNSGISSRNGGISRVSLGLQSAQDHELESLGRIHRFEDFLKTYQALREAGVKNINVDLMFGIPGQTEESWEDTLRRVTELDPEHISAYSLIIEEGTPFFEKYEKGLLALPDEETERNMAHRAAKILGLNGYRQYEFSNFAKPGRESRHNIRYWKREDYLGLGLGAASMIGNVRWSEPSGIGAYLARWENVREDGGFTIIGEEKCKRAGTELFENYEELSPERQMEEFMFLGLRMTEGVSIGGFEAEFGISLFEEYGPVLSKYIKEGFLKNEEGRIFLTEKGIDVSNVILSEFLLDD